MRDASDAGRQADLATGTSTGQHACCDRDDLRGVHAFADVVEESVRWSA